MLIWITMVCGLAQETWSRPAPRDADGYRGWEGDPQRTNNLMTLTQKRRTWKGRHYLKRPEEPVTYPYGQTLDGLGSKERYDYENQYIPAMPEPLTYAERAELRAYANAYTWGYVKRMVPHLSLIHI